MLLGKEMSVVLSFDGGGDLATFAAIDWHYIL